MKVEAMSILEENLGRVSSRILGRQRFLNQDVETETIKENNLQIKLHQN